MSPPAESVARFRLSDLLDRQKPDPMTQAELSRRSGVSAVTINRMVQNRTTAVSLRTLERLAAVLNCAPGDIIVSDRPAKRAAK